MQRREADASHRAWPRRSGMKSSEIVERTAAIIHAAVATMLSPLGILSIGLIFTVPIVALGLALLVGYYLIALNFLPHSWRRPLWVLSGLFNSFAAICLLIIIYHLDLSHGELSITRLVLIFTWCLCAVSFSLFYCTSLNNSASVTPNKTVQETGTVPRDD